MFCDACAIGFEGIVIVSKKLTSRYKSGACRSWLRGRTRLMRDERGRVPTAVITGAQIRQARKLLGWEPSKLAQRAKVHTLIVQRAESVAGEPPINGDEPGVKLKAKAK